MTSPLSGKSVIVTGGATGIGAAIVTVLESRGANVLSIDVRDGNSLNSYKADISTREGNDAAVAEAVSRFGALDGIVLNAGILGEGDVEATSSAEIDRLISVNLKGVIYGAQAALPHLRASRGSIVVTSSKTAVVAQQNLAVYAATKGGVLSLMRAMALDNARAGVRVNAVLPGVIHTEMLDRAVDASAAPEEERAKYEDVQPMGRLGLPQEVATVVTFLLSEDASFVTGVAVPVDGGFLAGRLD